MLGGVGITYVLAFWSLRRQVLALYGERGISPASRYLSAVEGALGRKAARRELPTVLWWGASDRALRRLCDAGMIAGGLLTANVLPQLSAACAFGAWLSLVSIGQEFLSFQWDALLLETGAAALALAPSGVRPGLGRHEPPWTARLLLRFLVFRLYFESGHAKLESRDPTWRGVRANRYYYETAPLPTPLGWYAHHLPPLLQDASTAATLGIECGLPFLVFGPHRLRRAAFYGFSLLQAAIAATGNYAFFNLLSFVLGLSLLDDADLARGRRPDRAPPPSWLRRAGSGALSLPLIALGAADLMQRLHRAPPRPLRWLESRARNLRLVSTYGLFAVMTTERPELSLEGSDDGRTWREYVLRYKPGPTGRGQRFVAPHQPRLDWQLWFAALQSYPPPWFFRFAQRVLEGSPEVLRLFAQNPFPDRPPRYLRALRYDYRMTDLRTRRRTGERWRRELSGIFLPAITLSPARELGLHAPQA